ncbi:MAG TPA: hypothetical protein PKX05_05465 [bacterium]|nr:hypothetical protein [bacterium]
MNKLYIPIFIVFFASILYGIEDKCIATVGNRIIWDNDVKERAEVRNLSYESALFELIAENLFAIQAKKENIPVSREEIDNRLNIIINGFPSKEQFFIFLSENGVSIDQYREILADQIRTEKFIAQKISSKIYISPVEIARRLSSMSTGNQVIILSKSFNNISEVEPFIVKLKENQNEAIAEMNSTGWIDRTRLNPALMQELDKSGKGNPVIIKSSERIGLYVLMDEKQTSPEENYMRARKELYNEKFNALLSKYAQELLSSISVKIFDPALEEKILHNK